MRKSRAIVAGVTAVALVLSSPAIASAHGGKKPVPDPRVVSDQVVAPFNLDLSGKKVYVADGFANMVGTLGSNGSLTPISADPQIGASGVANSADRRTLAFTTTEGEQEITASGLHIWGPRGSKVYADTLGYERAKNPDAKITYGPNSTDPCVTGALGPAYKGLVDSHAYSVASYGKKWVVADAGSNTLWSVDGKGKVRTLAVFPAQPLKITAAQASALKMPSCVVGVTYRFEAVPTDVEVGRDGELYVTTLPGGPEGPELGARGALWKVNPWNGRITKIASGFAGATNLAIGSRGEIYVAEYFAGRISVVAHGKKSTFLALPYVVAVESGHGGSLWAGTTIPLDPTAPQVPGTIVQIMKGHVHGKWHVKR